MIRDTSTVHLGLPSSS